MARRYSQVRRGEAADETRRRIVQATYELHGEQGIAATSMKQIAQRAGVSVGSVYHHFPTYDQAILACGAHAFGLAPVPTPQIFERADERAERVRRLVTAWFRMFEGLGAFDKVVADQEKLPVLKPVVDEEARSRLELARAALGKREAHLAPTLAALTDVGAFEALRRAGFSTDAAAQRVAEVANAWLDTQSPQNPQKPKEA